MSKSEFEPSNAERLLTPDEAAGLLGLSKQRLAVLRVIGGGPEYHKLSARVVRYSRGAINAWLTTNRRRSTSESQAAA